MKERLTKRTKYGGIQYENDEFIITCYPKNENLRCVDKLAVRLAELEDKIENGELVDKTELENKRVKNTVITNRQWLESLSDEQWAKHIPCFGLDNPFANCPKNIDCLNCKIEWLKSEHKEVE